MYVYACVHIHPPPKRCEHKGFSYTHVSRESRPVSVPYFEQVEDAGGLLQGVRLAKLLQLGQRSLQVAVGTQAHTHGHALPQPGETQESHGRYASQGYTGPCPQ